MTVKKFNRNFLFEKASLFFYLSIFVTMLSYILHLTEHEWSSKWGIISVLILNLVGIFCMAMDSKRISSGTASQMLCIYFMFALLWDMAFFSDKTIKENSLLILLGLFVLNGSVLFWLFVLWRNYKKISGIRNYIKNNIYILIIIIVFFSLSFETVYSGIKIDSYDYYEYIMRAVNWDFSFETFRNLQLCTHNSFGYSIFAVLGEYLWPGDGKGVRFVQIIMSCISIAAFSGIVKELGIDCKNRFENALITLLFAFTPLVLGTVFEIGLDLPMACFFIWFLYSFITNKKIFEAASIFLLLFSKEPGIFLLFGFASSWFIVQIYTNKKCLKNILKAREFWKNILVFLLPALFYILVFFLSDKWLSQDDSLSLSLDGNQLYKFGFNLTNIIVKNKEFFVLNFAWLFISLGIVCVVFNWKKLKTNFFLRDNKHHFYIFVLVSMLYFYMFNIFYITYCNPRYLTPYFVLLPLFLAALLSKWDKVFVRNGVYLALAIILLIQNFFTIDPILLSSFKNINVGEHTIITTRTFILKNSGTKNELSTEEAYWSANEMTHAASYNRQYSYLGSLVNEILAKIDYDDKTLVAIAPTYGEYMTKLVLFGNRSKEAVYYYDPDTKRQTLDSSKLIINIQVLKDSLSEIKYENYDRVFLLYFPYREKYYNADILLENADIVDYFDISYRGWISHIYRLQ